IIMSKKMCNNKTAVLLFLFLAIPLAGANISIPSVSASSGSSIQVPVNIDDATDVGGYNFTVTFDQGVLQATGASSGSLTSGWMLTPNISTPGQITVAGLDISLEGLAGGSGSLVLLNFNVMGNAGSTTNLVFSGNNKINDVNAQNLPQFFRTGHLP
ncbi:MAG TPA: cohesin domain-containing protein, partial [bacterium]|nr:cohesin domain-containing protein [bacterium]